MDISELVHHMDQTDQVTKKHPCKWPGCQKSFSRPSDATRHYRIHTNDRPFQCAEPYCGKRFIQRSALTVHLRTHSGERPHVCEVETCLKSFSDISSLARHRRIHTGNRPYKCHQCNRSFTKKTVLIRHARMCHDTMSTQQQQMGWYECNNSNNVYTQPLDHHQYHLPSPPTSQYGDCNTSILYTTPSQQLYDDLFTYHPTSPTNSNNN